MRSLGTVAFKAFLASLLIFPAAAAYAQDYPSRPIHIYVPTGPGTPPDVISRVVAKELGEREGWSVVVENKPGAIQTIAGSEVLKQSADGYALYALSLPVSAAPAFMPNIPFQPVRDFKPVVWVSRSYNVLVVTPSLPVKTVADLIALIKKEPGKLTFSSGGFGTPAHLIGEMFKLREHVDAIHVPYNQMPQAIGDLLGGTNQFMFITTLPVVGLINSGKLRGVAVTGPKRVAALPNVPTVGEEGHPELAVEDWVGFAVKAATSDQIVDRLNAAVDQVLKTESVRVAFQNVGAEPVGGSPAEFGQLIRQQVEHWSQVVKDSGIKLQQ